MEWNMKLFVVWKYDEVDSFHLSRDKAKEYINEIDLDEESGYSKEDFYISEVEIKSGD